jgi:hypothetical protein
MNMGLLLAALITVESGGYNDRVGDHGKSVGCLQIGVLVIEDVNNLCRQSFRSVDRLDREKSKQIAALYLETYCAGKSYEHCARTWNGGPNGWKKHNTNPYWEKVRKELLKLGVDESELVTKEKRKR